MSIQHYKKKKKYYFKLRKNDTNSFWSSVGDLYPIEFRTFNSNTQIQAVRTKRCPPLNVSIWKKKNIFNLTLCHFSQSFKWSENFNKKLFNVKYELFFPKYNKVMTGPVQSNPVTTTEKDLWQNHFHYLDHILLGYCFCL